MRCAAVCDGVLSPGIRHLYRKSPTGCLLTATDKVRGTAQALLDAEQPSNTQPDRQE